MPLGVPLAASWPSSAEFVAAAGRVPASGVAEQLELAGAKNGDRHLSMAVEPLDRGALLFARDNTAEERARDLAALLDSQHAALTANGAAAIVGISLRGYVEPPAPSLAELARLPGDALASTCFTSLIDVASRVAVEQVILQRQPVALDAALLVNRAGPLPVRVSLAPRRRGAAVDGVSAVLVSRRLS